MEDIPDMDACDDWATEEDDVLPEPECFDGTEVERLDVTDLANDSLVTIAGAAVGLSASSGNTCRIRPATLQIECHPHNSQEKLIRFAHQAGTKLTVFSVLGACARARSVSVEI